MTTRSLVQPMFEGPLDIVGDIHGEIEALLDLMRHLGYDEAGHHPENRRLIFVGDLIDRGPDSPAVLDLAMKLISAGRAQCVLGNHELNLLRGKRASHMNWFRGKPWKEGGTTIPQARLQKHRREEVLDFLQSLPIALERPDLRVVHAAWDDDAIRRLRAAQSTMTAFNDAHTTIEARLASCDSIDEVAYNLSHQNDNPVKLITSGPERRADAPFIASGKLRSEARHPWWKEYDDEPFCICGHYWRIPLPGKVAGDSLFNGYDEHDLLGPSRRVACIDYSVGGRYLDRINGNTHFTGRLAALRWPAMELVFDGGEVRLLGAGGSRLTPLRGFAPRKQPKMGKNRKKCMRG